MTSEEHSCAAWLLREVTHVPGVLRVAGGRLVFTSTRRVVFDATPDELEITASRTRRGRFHLVVDGERLTLSLVRPPGAVGVPTDLWARVTGEPASRREAAPDGVPRRLAALCARAAPRSAAPHGRRGRHVRHRLGHLAGLVRSSPPDPA